jgi:hypothetical protein
VAVYETSAEMAELQRLLDASIERAGSHLRGIVEPGRRTMTAEQVVEHCSDVCVLDVATTTSNGEPRLSTVDGHLLHGRWHFTTGKDALKARHLRARPAASAAWTPQDGLGIWVHGRAAFLRAGTEQWRRMDRHLVRAYDTSPSEWGNFGEIVYLRLDPQWMVGFTMTPDERTEIEAGRERRRERLAAPLTEEL